MKIINRPPPNSIFILIQALINPRLIPFLWRAAFVKQSVAFFGIIGSWLSPIKDSMFVAKGNIIVFS